MKARHVCCQLGPLLKERTAKPDPALHELRRGPSRFNSLLLEGRTAPVSERSRPIRLLLETSTTLASGLIVGVTLLLEPRTTWTRRIVRQLGGLLKGGSGAGRVGRHEGTPRGMARRPVSAPWPYSLATKRGRDRSALLHGGAPSVSTWGRPGRPPWPPVLPKVDPASSIYGAILFA